MDGISDVKKMTRERAEMIAKEFLHKMNPDMWNVIGEKPAAVNTKLWECELNSDDFLDISIEFDKKESLWVHRCEIVGKEDNTMTEFLSGYGIDSYLNLADTIEDICHGL